MFLKMRVFSQKIAIAKVNTNIMCTPTQVTLTRVLCIFSLDNRVLHTCMRGIVCVCDEIEQVKEGHF